MSLLKKREPVVPERPLSELLAVVWRGSLGMSESYPPELLRSKLNEWRGLRAEAGIR
jgi:hypothetical protein